MSSRLNSTGIFNRTRLLVFIFLFELAFEHVVFVKECVTISTYPLKCNQPEYLCNTCNCTLSIHALVKLFLSQWMHIKCTSCSRKNKILKLSILNSWLFFCLHDVMYQIWHAITGREQINNTRLLYSAKRIHLDIRLSVLKVGNSR